MRSLYQNPSSPAALEPSVGFGFLQNTPRPDIKIGIQRMESISVNWIHLAQDSEKLGLL
jgi:hypothetical protein